MGISRCVECSDGDHVQGNRFELDVAHEHQEVLLGCVLQQFLGDLQRNKFGFFRSFEVTVAVARVCFAHALARVTLSRIFGILGSKQKGIGLMWMPQPSRSNVRPTSTLTMLSYRTVP